jgi:hypothetical protein
MAAITRIPLGPSERFILGEPRLDSATCKKLLGFYYNYHEKNLQFFLKLRTLWHKQNPGRFFPGLCANINSITGEFRPAQEQFVWSWGDGRGLGIWSSFLLAGRVPDKSVSLDLGEGDIRNVNLKAALADYCDILYKSLYERSRRYGGFIPFIADIDTNRAVDDPRNPKMNPGEFSMSNLFSVNGFIQYGLLRRDSTILAFGMEMLDHMVKAIQSDNLVTEIGARSKDVSMHGSRMIALGVIGEVLKSLEVLERRGDTAFSSHKPRLIALTLPFIEFILTRHFQPDPPGFWEKNDLSGRPKPEPSGAVQVDPGHASEFSGFLAELVPFLPESWGHAKWNRKSCLEAALAIHLFAEQIGFSPKGVMFKAVDLNSGDPLPDTQTPQANGKPTAPWWNVREHCASALKLYTLTKDARLPASYQRAQNASYLYYPNKRIGGQMIQMVDPFTLEALDMAPATGNLDPMHDPRARMREIENLEKISGAR